VLVPRARDDGRGTATRSHPRAVDVARVEGEVVLAQDERPEAAGRRPAVRERALRADAGGAVGGRLRRRRDDERNRQGRDAANRHERQPLLCLAENLHGKTPLPLIRSRNVRNFLYFSTSPIVRQ
jgi:hypothetical protein